MISLVNGEFSRDIIIIGNSRHFTLPLLVTESTVSLLKFKTEMLTDTGIRQMEISGRKNLDVYTPLILWTEYLNTRILLTRFLPSIKIFPGILETLQYAEKYTLLCSLFVYLLIIYTNFTSIIMIIRKK